MSSPYFTWPDRRLRYECRGCSACCKGLGIGIDAAGGQLVQLVGKRPALAAFVRRRGDAVTAFNPRDRCWFLEDDGLCRIENEDGRAAKPASCRLFPFNRVFHVGATMVVDYNSVICPLVTAGEGGIAHAEVIAEIDSIKDPAIVGTALPTDDALIARERLIADAIFAPDAGLDDTWAAQHPGPLASAEDVMRRAFDTLLGAAWRLPSAATLANCLVLTPSLRFNELYGPRQYAPRPVIAPVLAHMWLAWVGFAALGEDLARRPLGMQELTTLWSEQAPLMHAIARWDTAPIVKPGPFELPNVDPGGLVRTLGQRCVDNKKAGRSLGALVGELFAAAEPATRVAALRMAEPFLRGAFTR